MPGRSSKAKRPASRPAGAVPGASNAFAALANLKLEEDGPSTSGRAPGAAAAAGAPEQDGQPAASAAAPDTPEAPAARAANKLRNPLVWIDLEMTGLDPDSDSIIEIACLVTDGDLKRAIEGPDLAVHHGEEVLEGMNDWCKEHHGKNGLTQRVRDSTTSLREAEEQVLAFIQEHTEFKAAQLAGNSVHVDRAFLARHMPRVVEHLHYRIVDVSTVGELARRWSPRVHKTAPRKVAAHTAMSDIKESLRELMHYRDALFNKR